MTKSIEDKLRQLARSEPSKELDNKVQQLFPAPYDPEFSKQILSTESTRHASGRAWLGWAVACLVAGVLVGYSVRPVVDSRVGDAELKNTSLSEAGGQQNLTPLVEERGNANASDEELESEVGDSQRLLNVVASSEATGDPAATRISQDALVKTNDGRVCRLIQTVTTKKLQVQDEETGKIVELNLEVPRWSITSINGI